MKRYIVCLNHCLYAFCVLIKTVTNLYMKQTNSNPVLNVILKRKNHANTDKNWYMSGDRYYLIMNIVYQRYSSNLIIRFH